MASSQSCSGAMITSSLNASAEERTSPSTVARQSLSRIVILRAALLRRSWSPRRTQGASQIGRAVSPQREHVGDDQLARLVGALALHRHDIFAEREHAVARRGPQRNRCRGDRRSRQWLATHRSAAVDQQAQGSVRSAPRPDPKALEVDGGACRGGLRDHVEAAHRNPGLHHRVCTAARRSCRRHAAPMDLAERDPRTIGRPDAGRDRAVVGRSRLTRSASSASISSGSSSRSVLHRSFVEFTDLGRHLLKPRVAPELARVMSCVGATP